MQVSRKYKTQICPQMQLLLYKSTQLKNPYYVKNRHNIGKQNNHSKDSSLFCYGNGKSSWLKYSQAKPLQFNKSNNKIDSQRAYESKTCQCKSAKSSKVKTKKVATQPIQNLIRSSKSQSKQYSHQNIQQLLGINTNTERSKKQNIKNTNINTSKHILNNEKIQNVIKLKLHNQQLMRNNQQLIYEKQFYKQKVLLQEVQIRDLNRKLETFTFLGKNKGHKKKLSFIQQPQISFKMKANSSLQIPNQINQNYDQKCQKDQNVSSQKSSLLISQESQARVRIPLMDKQIGNNLSRTLAKSNESEIYMKKTQHQFSQLLENIQNQNNQGRKATLRKMLAMKAVQLKKLKGKQ